MHWTDKHIKYNPGSQKYIAYDETGEELKRFYTKEAAKIYLINYAEAMENAVFGDHNLPR
jgi:hypothetical protein